MIQFISFDTADTILEMTPDELITMAGIDIYLRRLLHGSSLLLIPRSDPQTSPELHPLFSRYGILLWTTPSHEWKRQVSLPDP